MRKSQLANVRSAKRFEIGGLVSQFEQRPIYKLNGLLLRYVISRLSQRLVFQSVSVEYVRIKSRIGETDEIAVVENNGIDEIRSRDKIELKGPRHCLCGVSKIAEAQLLQLAVCSRC